MKDPTLVWALWASVVALAGLVGGFVRAILTGRLVPRSALDDSRTDRDKWEAAWLLSQATMGEFEGRLEANTEALRLVERLVEALATRGPTR